jgi:hypothetical protein
MTSAAESRICLVSFSEATISSLRFCSVKSVATKLRHWTPSSDTGPMEQYTGVGPPGVANAISSFTRVYFPERSSPSNSAPEAGSMKSFSLYPMTFSSGTPSIAANRLLQ